MKTNDLQKANRLEQQRQQVLTARDIASKGTASIMVSGGVVPQYRVPLTQQQALALLNLLHTMYVEELEDLGIQACEAVA